MPLVSPSKERRESVIGGYVVAFQKATGGPQTQDILAAWGVWISSESGKYIYGYNPMFLTCRTGDGCYDGQVGYFMFPGNTRKFAAFATRQDGVNAVVSLLGRAPASYGYGDILAAAQKGDYVAFLTSVANSAWVNGLSRKPGYGGADNLLRRWSDWIGKPVDTSNPTANYNPFQTAIRKYMDTRSIDPSETLTQDAFDEIVRSLGQDPTGGDWPQVARNFVGKTWSFFLENTATISGPNEGTDPLSRIAQVLEKLADPKSWGQIAGLLLGAIIVYVGFSSLMVSLAGENISPLPPSFDE